MKICLSVMLCLCALALPSMGQVPFSIQGPGVEEDDFRMTTFATGLNFPVGMTELSDGSIMVAVSNGRNFFGSSSGSILRLEDTDQDGVADSQTTLFSDVPGGGLTSLRKVDDLIFATGQGNEKPISILRAGASPADPLTLLGEINIGYNGSWLHPHSALEARRTPGENDSYQLFFQLGSRVNFQTTTRTLPLTSSIGVSGSLTGDAVHMITLTDDGTNVSGVGLEQIATGLRNTAGFAWHPETGDLFLQDNGIDGVQNPNEPTSADELNMILSSEIGGDIEDFGFAENFTEYRTGRVVGGGDIQPLVAFQPLPAPDGEESEGPNDIAFAPSTFPEGLNNGVFVGMHGKFTLGGVANEENPLVFYNLDDDSYFHFISNDEASVGHLDGLLSTDDSLFVADISPSGGFGSSANDSGVIYQLKSIVPSCSPANELLGDLDGDGNVAFADFLTLSGNFGQDVGSYDQGDVNCDGSVGFDDFLKLSANFGKSTAPDATEFVPESSGFSLGMIALALLVLSKKRQHS